MYIRAPALRRRRRHCRRYIMTMDEGKNDDDIVEPYTRAAVHTTLTSYCTPGTKRSSGWFTLFAHVISSGVFESIPVTRFMRWSIPRAIKRLGHPNVVHASVC